MGSITTDRLGNIIISGAFSNTITIGTNTFSSSGQKNVFVAKLDNAGNVIWATHFTSPGAMLNIYFYPHSLPVSKTGNLMFDAKNQ